MVRLRERCCYAVCAGGAGFIYCVALVAVSRAVCFGSGWSAVDAFGEGIWIKKNQMIGMIGTPQAVRVVRAIRAKIALVIGLLFVNCFAH